MRQDVRAADPLSAKSSARTRRTRPRLFIVDFRGTARRRRVRTPRGVRTVGGGAYTATGSVGSTTRGGYRSGRHQQQLRTRSWWSGPEIYVVIDDYDLVAPPTGGNPLVPLLDFLPYAKDLGLHVVWLDASGGAARGMFDPVLARLRELGSMGLMMSASPDEGVLLGTVRPSQLPPGRGTLVTRLNRNSSSRSRGPNPRERLCRGGRACDGARTTSRGPECGGDGAGMHRRRHRCPRRGARRSDCDLA